jgi:ABC-type dipeptide/oligopeptide/nickel transport system permease subunit
MQQAAVPVLVALGACRLVFQAAPYRYLASGLFLLALAFYLLTLPAAYTGGIIGLVSARYLNPELVFFSLVLALLLSLVLTLNLYGFRASLRHQGAGLSATGVLASLAPSSLCCTSLVPSLLAAAGASTPQIFRVTGLIQGTVARYESLFLVVALVLLLVSLYLAVRNILSACSLPERGGFDASSN